MNSELLSAVLIIVIITWVMFTASNTLMTVVGASQWSVKRKVVTQLGVNILICAIVLPPLCAALLVQRPSTANVELEGGTVVGVIQRGDDYYTIVITSDPAMPVLAMKTKSADFARGETVSNIKGVLSPTPNNLLPIVQLRHVEKSRSAPTAEAPERPNAV